MSVKLNVRRPDRPLFDAFLPFSGFSVPGFYAQTRAEGWSPPVEVVETADAVDVAAELPGVSADDVHVNVKDNTLTIDGEKRWERGEEDDSAVYYAERRYGKFKRSLTLPASVQTESAAATFKDGVLRIHLPKVERLRSRDIAIEKG